MAGSATVEKRLDFGLLGPLQMTIDGTPVPSGTPKQRAVLAMLVINRNRPVGVDALITALWEEWPPSGARASIHSYVSNLRKLLGGAGIDPRVVLAAAPPGYRLSIPDNTCDLGRFVAEKTAGVHAAAAGRFEQASRHLSAALREWRGPVLDDLRDFQFVEPFATALVEDKVLAHTAKAEAEIACGRASAVIAELEALTFEHPYREPLWTQLITAYYLSDRQSDALGAYRRVKTTLADDLGIDPAGDLALAAHEALSDPDQDHAADILRRSQESTLPAPPKPVPPPTMPATAMAPRQPPAPPVTPPGVQPAPKPSYTPPAQPGPAGQRPGPTGQPSWAPNSGPMPASGPTPTPQYYQGGGWGAPPSGGPSPWAQTPRKTNPWPLVAGAAAVVLVLVLGAIGIWIAIRPKPVQPPQPVAEERLSALLLNSSEVNAVMGSSSMQPGKPITSMDSSPVTVSLPDCQGALYTSQDPVYAGTGYTAINGLISSEPGDNYEHWVNQAVVAFPTADKARAFVQTSADKWKNCAGKTVTVTNKAKTYRWTFADVKGSPPTITVIDTQEGAEGWECQRAMSVANNVVVDVNACGYQITNQAGQIAAKIVDKVNKE